MTFRTVLTKGEMRHADRMTMECEKITGLELMQRAGTAMFHTISDHKLIDRNHDILVLAGSGNNGGDALFIASNLIDEGYSIRIHTIGNTCHRSPETKDVLDEIMVKGVFYSHLDESTFISFKEELEHIDCLIDGMFGTGFDARLDPFRKSVIEAINEANLNVISIDLPSGINARNGLCLSAIKANTTLVIQNEKPGNLLGDAPDYHGKRILVDAGIAMPKDLNYERILLSQDGMTFKKRLHHSHKYHFGHCLVIGGSTPMMGAPLLAAQAAMRTGAGLVTVAYGSWCFQDRMNIVPEIMCASFDNQEQLLEHLKKKDAIVFGMGFGKQVQSFDLIQAILDQGKPMVVDADGLAHLKTKVDSNKHFEHVLITPHLKEFSDLTGQSVEDVKNDPLKHAEAFAAKTGITVLLKGSCSILTDGKTTFFSEFGNPGLATAGSGDVLSGIIGALMAQGYDIFEASKKGLYLHGMAGDLARNRYGERSMIARDIINELSVVIRHATE